MAITVGKTSDLRKPGNFHLKTLIYGVPKVGKTRLAKTAVLSNNDDSRLLYIGVDPGQLSISDRDFSTIPQIGQEIKWDEDTLNEIYEYVRSNASLYDLIYVDGLDEIGDKLLREYKASVRDPRQAYGQLSDFASDWVKRMRDIPNTSIVFVTHMDQVQDDKGALIYKPAFPGNQVKNQLQAWFDIIGCMRFVPDANGDMTEMIQTTSKVDPRYESGDRSGLLDAFEKPNLAAIYQKIQNGGISTVAATNVHKRVSKQDLVDFGNWIKKHGIDPKNVSDQCKTIFYCDVTELNLGQLTSLKQILNDGITK